MLSDETRPGLEAIARGFILVALRAPNRLEPGGRLQVKPRAMAASPGRGYPTRTRPFRRMDWMVSFHTDSAVG